MSVNGFRKYSAKEGETEVKTCFKCDGPGVWLLKFNKNTNAGVCVCNGDCLRELEQKKHPRCAGCGFPKELSSREEKVWFLFNRYCGVDHSCGGMLFSQDPAVSVFHGQHPFFASCLKAPQPEEKKQQLSRSTNQRTQPATTAAATTAAATTATATTAAATTAATRQRTFADAIRVPAPAPAAPQVPLSPEQKELEAKRQEQEKTNNELRAKIEAKKQEKLAREQFALKMQQLKQQEEALQAELAQLEAELSIPA